MKDAKTAFVAVEKWVSSCKTPEHLATGNSVVSLYQKMYGNCPEYTKLCCALQLRRIDIKHLQTIEC